MSPSQNHSTFEWLPTAQAAQLLGISHCTLKRYAKRDGLLQEGIHFRRGPHTNTALLWNVQLCFETVRGAAVL